MTQDSMTIREILRRTTPYLESKGSSSPRLDAEVLLADILSVNRLQLYLDIDRPLHDEEIAQYREAVRRRAALEPVAYIVGVREFRSMPFAVTRATLIPRPDTETLVEAALGLIEGRDAPEIVDIGTGSGAVAISLARECDSARLWATDCSGEALEVARENACQLGVAGRIEFSQGDLFADALGPFDLVVSNPPYVAESDRASLSADVVEYEPAEALFAGADGLDIVRRLVAEAPARLKPGGALAIEIGQGQDSAVEAIINQTEGLQFESVVSDLGGIPRVAVARKC